MTKARDIASAAPAPAGVTSTELGYVDGVTSAIQTQVDAKIAKTLTTTTGDIIYASSANTPARLGIGTAAQVLRVNSGATAPEWATPASGGGLTLINTGGTTLTGSSVTISSIPGTYKNLLIILRNIRAASSPGDLFVSFDASGTEYMGGLIRNAGTTTNLTGIGYNNAATFRVAAGIGDSTTDRLKGNVAMNIYDYTSTVSSYADWNFVANNSSNPNWGVGSGVYDHTAAITSIKFELDSGNFTSGTAFIYGVN